MAVLKQTSPTALPTAPKPMPSSTVPSASTKSAVAFGSVHPESACLGLIRGLDSHDSPQRKASGRVIPQTEAGLLSIAVMIGAAIAEIGGCFAFWAWLRLGKSALWLVPGVFCLLAFAYLLTLVESSAAGRAYAAYGGIYILASLGWLWLAEGVR